MAPEHGLFVVRDKKGGGRSFQVKIGDKQPMNLADGEVSQSLLDQVDLYRSASAANSGGIARLL
jgi:hypothetical protein